MGYRQRQHGIRSSKDLRVCAAACRECGWIYTLELDRSSETKGFYRCTKDHVENTGHVVDLSVTHEVTYEPAPPKRFNYA